MASRKTVLYLLGKTGTGKSSTGNTLLAGPSKFKASSSSSASTQSIEIKETNNDNWDALVVDGPGLVGVDIGFDRQAMLQFKEVVNDYKNCGHVFLIVIRYGERFTREDSEMVRNLKKEFGNDVFERHGVVLVTCCDNFEVDYEDEDITIESWALEQKGEFGNLIKECNNRVLGVDNTKRASREKDLLLRLHSCVMGMHNISPFQTAPKKRKETTPIRQNEIEPTGRYESNRAREQRITRQNEDVNCTCCCSIL